MCIIMDLDELFFLHLKQDRCASDNTVQAYKNDIICFNRYLSSNGKNFLSAKISDVENFKTFLKSEGRAVASVSRSLSSVRAFYNFLLSKSYVSENPAKTIKNDKPKDKVLEVLSSDEIDTLLMQPSGSNEKAVRDRAILELLYATGLKVSELAALDITDYNETMSFIRCRDSSSKKERYIPLYPKAKKLLSTYISVSRKLLICDSDEKALFVNVSGSRMTRQGLWKIIKYYAAEDGIKKDITPKTLRHSFATHLLENGADVMQLKDILGHADISTTNIYVDYLKKRMANSLIRLHPHA